MSINYKEEDLWAYLHGHLTESEMEIMAENIKNNPDLLDKMEDLEKLHKLIEQQEVPSDRLRKRFYVFLEEEKKLPSKPEISRFTIRNTSWLKAAAVLMLAAFGFLLGRYLNSVDQLSDEVATNKQLILSLFKEEQSSNRIHAVNQTYTMNEGHEDPDITDALIHTLVEDPSANVRLAALEALKTYTTPSTLKDVIINRLNKERDASIQISMIHILSDLKASTAVNPLKHLVQDASVRDEVKGEAQLCIFKLDSYQKM